MVYGLPKKCISKLFCQISQTSRSQFWFSGKQFPVPGFILKAFVSQSFKVKWIYLSPLIKCIVYSGALVARRTTERSPITKEKGESCMHVFFHYLLVLSSILEHFLVNNSLHCNSIFSTPTAWAAKHCDDRFFVSMNARNSSGNIINSGGKLNSNGGTTWPTGTEPRHGFSVPGDLLHWTSTAVKEEARLWFQQ